VWVLLIPAAGLCPSTASGSAGEANSSEQKSPILLSFAFFITITLSFSVAVKLLGRRREGGRETGSTVPTKPQH